MQRPQGTGQPGWKEVWDDPRQRARFAVIIVMLLVVAYCFSLFLRWLEGRNGHVMNDPVLALFQPVDVSAFTFTITYLPVIAGAIYASRSPMFVMRTASAYATLLLFRMSSLYFVPLDPPADIIPLRDPLLELTVYEGRVNRKDLFFSGHTATHFMFFLLVKQKRTRMFFLLCAVAIGILVLMQHVHYTVDVLAAPVFAWLAVKLASLIPGDKGIPR